MISSGLFLRISGRNRNQRSISLPILLYPSPFFPFLYTAFSLSLACPPFLLLFFPITQFSLSLPFLSLSSFLNPLLPPLNYALIISNSLIATPITGVINSNGQRWQNARRFLLRNLRDLGMGKTYLEEAIHREAAALVDDFKKNPGTNKNFPKSINVAVLNVVWQMVASESHFIFFFFPFQ